jgi:hypothetical protein
MWFENRGSCYRHVVKMKDDKFEVITPDDIVDIVVLDYKSLIIV